MTNIQSLSDRKRALAQANGAKSRGPTSAEGQARSSQNALKHGLLSASMMLPTEHPEFFDDLNRDITLELRPASVSQAILARSFAMCALRLNRIWDLEAAAQRAEIAGLPEPNGVEGTLEAWRRLHSRDHSFGLLRRYEITFTRELHRSLRHLRELQENDAEPNEPVEVLTPSPAEPPAPPERPSETVLPPCGAEVKADAEAEAEAVPSKSPLTPLILILALLTLAQAASNWVPLRRFSPADTRLPSRFLQIAVEIPPNSSGNPAFLAT